MNDAIPGDVPFSLSCAECDCDSPDSYEDAVKDGWTEIRYTPESNWENFLGLCPDCRLKEKPGQRAEQPERVDETGGANDD